MIARKAVQAVFPIMIAFTACTTSRVNSPDENYDAVRTQAVQTAVMQITADAVLHPKATATPLHPAPFQDTARSEPETEKSDEEPGNDGQGNPLLVEGNPGSYACIVDMGFQSPPDRPRQADETYQKTWRIQNTGSASWRSDRVAAEWVGGTHMCTKDRLALEWNVAPGDTVDIRVPVHVPEDPSKSPLMMAWALVDGDGNIFCKFYHSITVEE